MSRSAEELERALAAAEGRAAELQAWVDSAEEEAGPLRARLAELEARPPPKEDARLAELQAWVDSAEAEAEVLRARVATLEATPPPKSDARLAELQAWADSAEAEAEVLRARVATLEATPPPKSDARLAELQAWADSAEAEAEVLRARVATLEATPPPKSDARLAELQAWADSAEAEAEVLRARVATLEATPPEKNDARVAELQAWVDTAEEEAGTLRTRVAELEARPPPKEDARLAELQAWVDAAEEEAGTLRARVAELEATSRNESPHPEQQVWEEEAAALRTRVAELEARPAKEDPRVAELQAWIDSAEDETDGLRARITELEARPAPKEDGRVAELQAWIDSEEEEVAGLRTRVAELEAQAPDRRLAEVQSWLDAAEQETKELRTRASDAETDLARAKERLSLLGDSVGEGTHLAVENRELVARISELESVNHSLRALGTQLASRVDAAARRDVAQLTAQLEEARSAGAATRVVELEGALATAQEAVATLHVQREAAVDQVRRYVEGDAQTERAHEQKQRDEHADAERKVAALEAQLAGRSDEVAVLQVRLKAHETAEQKLETDVKALRERACTAEQALGATQSELEVLRDDKGTLEARSLNLARKLEEAQRWLAQGEIDTAELKKELSAAKTERAVVGAPAEALATVARALPPPPPADAADATGDELEGFSPQHLHRLEALLALEKVKSGQLEAFAQTAETSLRRMQDELEAAGGRLADLRKRLGLADAETGETYDRLEAARRELHALFSELAHARDGQEGELVEAEEVLDAPLAALEELATQQATATQEATHALQGEQRAREQLVGDLTWLKAELEKLSNVREELRSRITAMVQRELKRKQVVSALLDKLRSTEVASAARAGTLRRLHAAMDKAQATAVRAQTVYFQKQIGSLQRQLEKAQKAPQVRLSLAPLAGRGSG